MKCHYFHRSILAMRSSCMCMYVWKKEQRKRRKGREGKGKKCIGRCWREINICNKLFSNYLISYLPMKNGSNFLASNFGLVPLMSLTSQNFGLLCNLLDIFFFGSQDTTRHEAADAVFQWSNLFKCFNCFNDPITYNPLSIAAKARDRRTCFTQIFNKYNTP